MTPIGWAILGTGMIARKFAAALPLAKGARLASVMSRDAATATAFAAAAGGARGVASLEDVLADRFVDIVYVATPNHLHAGQSIACLQAGKAVLCEKPLATSAGEAEAIAAAAEASGCFFMEALWTLCLPALDKATALIREGRIGPIREITGSLSFGRDYDPENRLFSHDLGGGALLDLGVYPAMLAFHFLGRPQSVRGSIRPAPNGLDMQAAFVSEHDGALAQIACGFHATGANDMVITGETGIIRLQAPLHAPALVSLTPTTWRGDAPGHHTRNPLAQICIARDTSSRLDAMKQMLHPLKPGRTRFFPAPYRGNGMVHQIEEAMLCLHEGRSGSSKVPLALSLMVQQAIEAVKEQNKSLST